MSLYQCEKCGCIENTALGHYHCRNLKHLWDEKYINKRLCSECGPPTFKDGEPTKYGKWHNRFEKKIYQLNSLYTDDNGNVKRKSDNKNPWEE